MLLSSVLRGFRVVCLLGFVFCCLLVGATEPTVSETFSVSKYFPVQSGYQSGWSNSYHLEIYPLNTSHRYNFYLTIYLLSHSFSGTYSMLGITPGWNYSNSSPSGGLQSFNLSNPQPVSINLTNAETGLSRIDFYLFMNFGINGVSAPGDAVAYCRVDVVVEDLDDDSSGDSGGGESGCGDSGGGESGGENDNWELIDVSLSMEM